MAAVNAPAPTQPQQSSFVFINDTHPEDANSKTKRKLVRAQAARNAHAQAVNTSSGVHEARNQPMTNQRQSSKRRKKERASSTFLLNLAGLEDVYVLPSKPGEKSIAKDQGVIVPVEDKGIKPAFPNLLRKTANTTSTLSGSQTSVEAKRSTNEEILLSSKSSTTLVLPNPRTRWATPFESQPDPEKVYIPMLTDHCKSILAMISTSPATFNFVLPNPETCQILLQLKQQTLVSINTLIRDTPPGEPMSDIVIAAVVEMASYESMFGSPTTYHTHMRGLQDMVIGRGGLQKLGFDGLLMRMILWVDMTGAFTLNSPAYF